MRRIKESTIYNCSVIELNKINNRAGNITVVENQKNIPFDVKRIYYLYDVPSGANRGGHAHKDLMQLIVAAGGNFEVVLDDGRNKKVVSLNRPNFGLLIVPGIWREMINFSSGSICLVLASAKYDTADYIRDYNEFKLFKEVIHF